MATASRFTVKGFYFLTLSVVVAVLAIVSLVSVRIAIKGGYALAGTLIAGAAFFAFDEGDSLPVVGRDQTSNKTDSIRAQWLAKGTVVVTLSSLPLVVILENRLLLLLVTLPIGYALLALQIHLSVSPKRLVPQIALLYGVSPTTKYLMTGFYFGAGDTIGHLIKVRSLLAHGTTSAISGVYQSFPGLHLLTATFHYIAGVPPYDALLILGILFYIVFVVPLVYLFARLVTADKQLAVVITLLLSTLSPITYYSTFFFPQALAVPLVLLFVYIAFRMNELSREKFGRWLFVSVGLSFVLIFTHHFTIVLWFPIFLILLLNDKILGAISWIRTSHRDILTPHPLPLLLLSVMAITYWTVWPNGFLGTLAWGARQILSYRFFAKDVGGGTEFYTFDVVRATPKLVTIEMLYNGILFTLLLLGIMVILKYQTTFRRVFGVFTVGIVGSITILQTPILINSLGRASHPMSFFFSFLTGVGLFYLLHCKKRRQTALSVALIVIVILGTVSPLLAADDTSWPLEPRRSGQNTFSEMEYQQLESMSHFLTEYKPSVSTFWITNWTMEMFGVRGSSATVTSEGVKTPPGTFAYRNQWPDHSVKFIDNSLYVYNLLFSEEWFYNMKMNENKIYDAGAVGLLWKPDGGILGEGSVSNNQRRLKRNETGRMRASVTPKINSKIRLTIA